MGEVIEFELSVELTSCEFTCGHINYMTTRFLNRRFEDHENFYCTSCGRANCYPAPKGQQPDPPERKSVGAKIVSLFKKDE